MKKNNNLIVADSTPLGQAGKPVVVDNSHIYIAQQREQARAQRSANINARANERHLKEMIEIVATRDYGNKKTARRFELSPELHLIAEMREVLKRGAFPAYAYDNGSINIVTVADPSNYDVAAAGEYYYNVQGKLRTFDATLTNMIVGYTEALRMLIDDYPGKADAKGSIKDLLMREFVDQVHRKTRGDVETGVQVNFIEDYELIKETSGCEPTMKLLDRCYARIEDIESGLATYEQHDEELYFSPSPYPVLDEQKQKRFLNAYKNNAHKEFAEFFNGFDYVASSSFDFMMNFLIQMKDALIDCETPFGENLENYNISFTNANAHIQAVTDLKNSIRKKGQLLSALAVCIDLGWDKEPLSQTATANVLYRETVQVWIDNLLIDLHVGPLPDNEFLFKDEDFINSIYLNNEPLSLIDNILRVWLHAKKLIVQMEVAYDRDYLPLYNFVTNDYEHGQHFTNGDSSRRVTVEDFYEVMSEYTEQATEGIVLALKPYKRMYN